MQENYNNVENNVKNETDNCDVSEIKNNDCEDDSEIIKIENGNVENENLKNETSETAEELKEDTTYGPVVDMTSSRPTTVIKETVKKPSVGMDENFSNDKGVHNPSKQNGGKGFAKLVLSAIVFGLIASATFLSSNVIFKELVGDDLANTNRNEKIEIGTTELVIENEDGDEISTSISNVVKNVMPSVVSITNLSVQEVEYFFFGTQQYETENNGSGIIVGKNNEELLIVTNNHVVEGYKTLTVSFIDEESVEAIVKGTDPDIDLAIVAVPLKNIKNETLNQIKVATIGNSDALTVGEPAIAIGNALGYGQSVTSGIISALNREIEGLETKLIQTDAAIYPGNSGGALLNIKGEVFGINTVKVSADAVESMGYAIPMSDAEEILHGLMNRETREKVIEVQRGVLGISGVDVDENASLYYNMPKGCFIAEVTEDGAAAKAGIPKGCILTKFDGLKISGMTELKEQMSYYEAGETVDVVVAIPQPTGDYEEKTFTVTLGGNKSIQSN